MSEEVKPVEVPTPAPAAPAVPPSSPAAVPIPAGPDAKPLATPEPGNVLADARSEKKTDNILADAKKPADAKPGEPSKPAEPATPFDPKTLKLADGAKLDETVVGAFAETLNDPKLSSQDRGQKLIELHQTEVKKFADTAQGEWNKLQGEWKAAIKADPEIGGANYDSMVESVGKLLDNPAFADKATKEAFLLTGAGNNPAIVRFVSRVAKALTEGGHVAGNPPSPKPKSAEQVMYGSGSSQG